MRALLIHGAGASPLSWRTFRGLTVMDTETFSYDVSHSFDSIIEECLEACESFNPDVVVGHSFGGVVAWHAARIDPGVLAGVSISSPWGGSAYCDLVEALTIGFLPTRFFANIGYASRHLVMPRTEPSRVPWLNVVTTRGLIETGPRNDGVLTVTSQESLFHGDNVLKVPLHFNHSEVLQTDDLAQTVDSFARRVERGIRRGT